MLKIIQDRIWSQNLWILNIKPFDGKIFLTKIKRRGQGTIPSSCFRVIFLHLLIVSATLPEVETLKHPPSHKIWFLDEIFRFFNLVSDFFSYWNFSRNKCQLLVLRYCFIYIFDIKNYNLKFGKYFINNIKRIIT